MATPRRRALVFALLAVAVTGPVALLASRGAGAARPVPAAVGPLGPLPGAALAQALPAPSAPRPVVVVAQPSSLATYLDLAIRVAALALAWHCQRAENGPPPRGRTVVGRRRS